MTKELCKTSTIAPGMIFCLCERQGVAIFGAVLVKSMIAIPGPAALCFNREHPSIHRYSGLATRIHASANFQFKTSGSSRNLEGEVTEGLLLLCHAHLHGLSSCI